MKQIKLQQGQAFKLQFFVMENNVPSKLKQGEYIAIGFYDEYCGKYVVKSNKNEINYDQKTGMYYVIIPSDITKAFSGNVDIEVAVYDNSSKNITPAKNIIQTYFEERKIIKDI